MKKARRLSNSGHKAGPDAAIQKEGGAATVRNSQSIQTQAEARNDALDAKKTGETKDEESEPESPESKPGSMLDLVEKTAIDAYLASSSSGETEPEIEMLDLTADRHDERLDAAERIMEAARRTISDATTPPLAGLEWWPYRSINKRNEAKHGDRQKAHSYPTWVNARQMAFAKVRKGMSNHMTMDELHAHGARVQQEKVGNCFDLSALTTLLLSRSGEGHGAVVDVVRLGSLLPTADGRGFANGDHAFVVLNPPPADKNGKYPDDFGEWGHAIIIDPWAKIACKAIAFPQRWEETMKRWKLKKKAIDTVTASGAGTTPPDEHPWIDGILVFEKVSVTKGPRPEPAPGGDATGEHSADSDDHHGQKCAICSVM
jgi:hypothetical protein